MWGELGENYSCYSSSQPVFSVEFTAQGTSSSIKPTFILLPPYGMLEIVEFPKSSRGFFTFLPKILMAASNLGPLLSLSLQRGQENQGVRSSQGINHSPTVPGCLPENSWELQIKIKQKAPTKPNQNTSFAAKSWHCFQGVKQSSTCRDSPEGAVPELFFSPQFKSETKVPPEFPFGGECF